MNPSQQQLERIVAYLDGELSAEESAQVEQQLAADNDFRRELQGAERAWQALDELPMTHVGDDFSRTTMEMVVDAARQDVEARTIAMPVQRRKRRAATALLATMAVLLGALMVRVVGNGPNRRLVADLPVIHNVDIYSQFQSAAFLRELQQQLGDDLDTSDVEAAEFEIRLEDFQRVSSIADRERWLEALTSDQQVTLRAKFNRFRDLSPQQQDELRALHKEIDTDPDRESLLQTMFRYQLWLNELPSSEQYRIRKIPASDRAGNVAIRIKQDAKEQQFQLTPDQLQQLYSAVRPHFEKIVLQRMMRKSQQKQDDFRSWPESRRRP